VRNPDKSEAMGVGWEQSEIVENYREVAT